MGEPTPIKVSGPAPAAKVPFVPNYQLTAAQVSLLEELRGRVATLELSSTEREYCDDSCLVRFLRARDW